MKKTIHLVAVTIALTTAFAPTALYAAPNTQMTTAVVAETDKQAVNSAATELFTGLDLDNVTSNLPMSIYGTHGTRIAWTSSASSVVSTRGIVNRPSYSTGNKAVTLTARITKGYQYVTKTFQVTVLKKDETNLEAVTIASNNLALDGVDPTAVISDLTLPTSGTDGTTINWSSSLPSVIANDGTVSRPGFAYGDKTVYLTATITKGTNHTNKMFTLKVLKANPTDDEAIGVEYRSLSLGNTNNISRDLTLPTTGLYGTTISWSSNNTSVVANDGTVTRPAFSSGDATVTLTATISSNAESVDKQFTIHVPKLAETDSEAVDFVDHTLSLGNTSLVTRSLTLPTNGAHGTRIHWSSSDSTVITSYGIVTRPSYTVGDRTATLTATITKGSVTTTKTFSINVVKNFANNQESVDMAKSALTLGDTSAVTDNLYLPKTGSFYTTITWQSSNARIVSTNGTIKRPAYTDNDQTVTLTATISKGTSKVTKTFTVVILKKEQTALEKAQVAVTALFKDRTKTALADGVSQNTIDAAQDLIASLPANATKTALQNDLNKAQSLWNKKVAIDNANAAIAAIPGADLITLENLDDAKIAVSTANSAVSLATFLGARTSDFINYSKIATAQAAIQALEN